jgi:hypothetical protein
MEARSMVTVVIETTAAANAVPTQASAVEPTASVDFEIVHLLILFFAEGPRGAAGCCDRVDTGFVCHGKFPSVRAFLFGMLSFQRRLFLVFRSRNQRGKKADDRTRDSSTKLPRVNNTQLNQKS